MAGPLYTALADGDRVLAVIRGSAVNNHGGGETSCAPRQAAQEDAIRLAHERACATPDEVQYVELHGTGTKAGDPVKAAALGAALGNRRTSPPSAPSSPTWATPRGGGHHRPPQDHPRDPPPDAETLFVAIIYVLVSGCAWQALPPCFGISKSTAHRRFLICFRAGV